MDYIGLIVENLPPLSTAPAKAARLVMGGLRPKENNGFGLARVLG
jgi:hypothetical protein